MKTIHLAGYHDSFGIRLNELRNKACFTPGTFYLIEIPLNIESVDLMQGIECESDLESKLHNLGLNHTVSSNIAQLVPLKPAGMIPCATNTKDFGTDYQSARDIEIMQLVKKAIDNLNNENITFFGGSKHAKYMAKELEFPHKILYDFRLEQAVYNLDLKNLLIKERIITVS